MTLLGILTALITILYLLDNLGVHLGGLNPWSWRRRRAWRKKYEGDPIFAIEDPVEVAALFVLGGARLGGDLTAEQKRRAIEAFGETFSLDERAATDLTASSLHLLGAPQLLGRQLEKLCERHTQTFSAEQAASVVALARDVVSSGGQPSAVQQQFFARLGESIARNPSGTGPWSAETKA